MGVIKQWNSLPSEGMCALALKAFQERLGSHLSVMV